MDPGQIKAPDGADSARKSPGAVTADTVNLNGTETDSEPRTRWQSRPGAGECWTARFVHRVRSRPRPVPLKGPPCTDRVAEGG